MAKRYILSLVCVVVIFLAVFSVEVFRTYKDLIASAQSAEFSETTYDQVFAKAEKLHKELRMAAWSFHLLPKRFQDKYALLDRIVRAKPVMDELLSFGQERTFLVVLQNNTELRPSGGFWGAYGILKVKDAQIVDFTTGNSATLDLASQGKFEPPVETKEFFDHDWRFVSANWSPDFAQSVEQGLYFYRQVYPDQRFDGVIGPDVDYLLSLLKTSGDLPVPNHNFSVNNGNFIQKMIYEPVDPAVILEKKNDPNFLVADEARKPMLADLAKTMIERIVASKNYRAFGESTLTALTNKDLLLYFGNSEDEDIATKLGWSGKIDTTGNYVMTVDGNMGSKLDFLIDKSAKLQKLSSNTYKISLVYKNNYDAANPLEKQYFITYRSLLRLFVPVGSKLLSFSGGQMVAQENLEAKMGSTFFDNLVIIKPGESTTLSFVWQIPDKVAGDEIRIINQAGSKLNY